MKFGVRNFECKHSPDEAKPDTDTICPFRKRQNALWAPGVCFAHRLSVPLAPGARVSLTGRVRYRYTGPVWPETGRYRSKSNLNSKFAVQTVRTGIPVGLTSNPPNSKKILFWFKFNCPQSILNECLYNMF